MRTEEHADMTKLIVTKAPKSYYSMNFFTWEMEAVCSRRR